MNSNETDTKLEQIERILNLATRLVGFVKVVVAGAVLAVLWVARMEWTVADHEHRLASAEVELKPLTNSIERMKGHLGISASETVEPPNVVWTEEQKQQEAH